VGSRASDRRWIRREIRRDILLPIDDEVALPVGTRERRRLGEAGERRDPRRINSRLPIDDSLTPRFGPVLVLFCSAHTNRKHVILGPLLTWTLDGCPWWPWVSADPDLIFVVYIICMEKI
jgi:hypothetical protein